VKQTLQATGIAFNVILVRSSARRDQQFTAFDHHERTLTVIGQGAEGSATIGSLNLSHHPHGRKSGGCPGDLEMAVRSTRSPTDKPSESDFYPGGITVTKVIHSS
jgi:hypothetical protein